MDDEWFLNWIADRLVNVLGDATENTDYIIALRGLAGKQAEYKHLASADVVSLPERLTDVVEAARMFYGES